MISFIRDGSYQQVTGDEKNYLHTGLLNWLYSQNEESILHIPEYLKTKFAVLLALIIKVDYPQAWSDAFEVCFILLFHF